jgi:hypothetical protein
VGLIECGVICQSTAVGSVFAKLTLVIQTWSYKLLLLPKALQTFVCMIHDIFLHVSSFMVLFWFIAMVTKESPGT